ncbi:MAG: DUF5989 family protein [Nitrospirota bacterium]
MKRLYLLKEIALYLYYQKKWWLVPIIVVVGFMALFAAIIESSAILPFIYTIF